MGSFHSTIAVLAVSIAFGAITGVTAPSSTGNTDGVLTWNLGAIEPGGTAREVVFFALGDMGKDIQAAVTEARREFSVSLPGAAVPEKPGPEIAWIGNKATDFALESAGCFFWEKTRQSLKCGSGGQLSRFGYAIHCRQLLGGRAATSITKSNAIENLQVVYPVTAVSPTTAIGTLKTMDDKLRIQLRAMVGSGAWAGVEFILTNVSQESLKGVSLSAYANVEADHTHQNDYCQLDATTQGLLTLDPATEACVVMCGLRKPESGFAGTWASEAALMDGTGTPFREWKPFKLISEEKRTVISRRSVPHSIANTEDASEPETRTFSADEADDVLVTDWLYQTDNVPTPYRVTQEIAWAEDIAARIARDPEAPDLTPVMSELDAVKKQLSSPDGSGNTRKTPLPQGLAGCWTCDAKQGSVLPDSSGHGYDGTIQGRVEFAPAVAGNGLVTSGGAVVKLTPELLRITEGPYTLAAWIRTNLNETDIIGSGVGKGHVLLMNYKGVVRAHHWTTAGGNVLDGRITVNDGHWHHVAQVRDDKHLAIYVDGKLDVNAPFKGESVPADAPLLIGSRAELDGPGRYGSLFDGGLDDVCVFDRALSADELRTMWEEGKTQATVIDEAAKDLYIEVRRLKRRIMFSDPAIDFDSVLFVDNPYPQGSEWRHEARHRDGIMAVPGGRLLVLKGLHPGGELRKLAPGGTPASFWRPDLSFDADKVLFCMKPTNEKSFHLYEIGLDGTGLRQLTNSDYDDLDPIYLPDGHIMFSSTRCNTYVRCMPYTYSYVLARCDGDGRNIYLISRGNEPDWLPALLSDGRVMYTRWEYTDKPLWRIQSLWTINPDGTNVATLYGNQSVWPDMLIEARPIPDSSRVMFVGCGHHNWFGGPVGIIDTRKGFNFPDGLTKVTADVAWTECGRPPIDPIESGAYHRSGAFTAYKTPFPLSEELFLVSARTDLVKAQDDGTFALYLMDVQGNRELIYRGAHNVWHALPIKKRPRPLPIPDRVVWPGTGTNHTPAEDGILYSSDIYQGAPDLPRGMVKYLRVVQMDHRTYSTWTRDQMPHQHQGPTVSILQSDGIKRILGTVPVNPDGSVLFRIPSGKSLFFQLLDENFRALQTMRSFTGVMPGERRGCVGCHELHTVAPINVPGARLKGIPASITPPPWGVQTTLGYERMIHPILEEHCGRCHTGEGKGKAKLDLTLRPGKGIFKEPYVTLVGGSAYHDPKTLDPQPSLAGCMPVETWPRAGVPQSVQTFAPLQYMSYRSRLINDFAGSGKHHGVKVPPSELRILSAWVDITCPFRGDTEIRALPDPDFPGIESLPIRPRVQTAPVIDRFNLQQDTLAEHSSAD